MCTKISRTSHGTAQRNDEPPIDGGGQPPFDDEHIKNAAALTSPSAARRLVNVSQMLRLKCESDVTVPSRHHTRGSGRSAELPPQELQEIRLDDVEDRPHGAEQRNDTSRRLRARAPSSSEYSRTPAPGPCREHRQIL